MGPTSLAESAHEWGVTARTARWLFLLPIVLSAALFGTSFVYAALGGDGRWLVERGLELVFREDGPVEWAQFVCFAIACFAAGALGRDHLRAGRKRMAAGLAVVCCGLFFVAGEEISWGQRLLDIATPAFVSGVNDQNELNLHNITGVRDLLDYPRMLIAAWAIAAALGPGRVPRTFGPPSFLAPCFAVILGYDVLRLSLWNEAGAFLELVRYGEWPELCFAFGIATGLVLLRRRRARTSSRSDDGNPTRSATPVADPESMRRAA